MNAERTPPPARRPTIVDVARLAGVSRQTVTRAINDMPGISEQTRSRVLAAAQELRYRPSRFGRGLVKSGTPTLGLVVNDLTNPYYAEFASNVLKFAGDRGWALLIAERYSSFAAGFAGLQQLAMQVDAVVGYLEPYSRRIGEIFGDMPIVNLEQQVGTPLECATIDIDFAAGLRAAIDHLIESGRKHIVMIDGGSLGMGEGKSGRALSYEEFYRERGFEPRVCEPIDAEEPDLQAGMAATERTLRRWPETDGIIAFNDIMAIGALRRLRLSGVPVPERCAVVGIDGIPLGALVSPELTTLSIDLEAMAKLAVELVVGMANGELPLNGADVTRVVTPTLTLRESS